MLQLQGVHMRERRYQGSVPEVHSCLCIRISFQWHVDVTRNISRSMWYSLILK